MTPFSDIRALTFDVFGTVVDWRSSIVREAGDLTLGPRLADAWRAGYAPAMARVRSGALPWRTIDRLHRMILDELIPRFGLDALTETQRDDLNRVWHRLDPWPDAIDGLARLRRQFIVAALSNGNMALLVNMAKRAGLPWDCIFSAELAGHYKPDPEVYQMAAALLDLPPSTIMMVAAHEEDLIAARAVGFRTAFVHRPLEFGPDHVVPRPPDGAYDIVATDFHDLAARLAAA
jgi:2-haloacid dehalogenase